VKLAEMTWEEVHALDRNTVVVVPFGAMEQHGPHMPMNTDALIGQALASRLDAACGGDLLVLPTQWLGLSPHHMKFAGTITASPETFIAMAFEIISSIASAGFTNFFILNSHGGNASALDVVATKCKTAFPDRRFLTCTYWNVAAADLSEMRESKLGGMGHACELETSLVMAEQKDLVRTERIAHDGGWPASPYLAKDMLKGGAVSLAATFDEISTRGAVGDPTTSSAEKGVRFFEVILKHLVTLVGDLRSGGIVRLNHIAR